MGLFSDLLASVINRLRQLKLMVSGKPDADQAQRSGGKRS